MNVYKSLTIRSTSGNPADTIVQAANSEDHVFEVITDYVNISGFTVTGAKYGAGIYLGNNVNHCNISNNNVSNNYEGISLESSTDNTHLNNVVSQNSAGISLSSSGSNTLWSNTVNSNHDGINLGGSNSNRLENNIISENYNNGIYLYWSSGNKLTNNTASNNTNYDFYSTSDSHNNTVKDLLLSSYTTTVSFTYDNGLGLKGVNNAEAPSDPADKMNISKYVNAKNVSAKSWLFLNVSYEQSDLESVDENCLRMWKYNGTDWAQVAGTNGVNISGNYVYANITEFSIFAPLGDTGTYIPPNATGLQNTTGKYWVNYTWTAGAGANVTDSYNVSMNGTWTNGTSDTYMNVTVGPSGWANITVWTYNVSGGGTLSSGSVSDGVQTSAAPPEPTPRKTGGGGGGARAAQAARADTDRDGYTDYIELQMGTDPNDPCDPNPKCAACLALEIVTTPTPTAAPKEVPKTAPTTSTAASPEPKEEVPGFEALFAIAGLLAVAYLVRRRKK